MAVALKLVRAKLARWILAALFVTFVTRIVVLMTTADLSDMYLTPLLDYGSFMHSAEALASGLNPYVHHAGIQPPPSAPYGVNLNPPVSLLPFTALNELVAPDAGRLALQIVTVLGFVTMLAILALRYPANAGAITLATLVLVSHIGGTVWWGQIYVLLGLCSLTGILVLEKGRWVVAGIAFGLLVAMKPPFVLVPLFLLATGHRREGAAILGVAGALSLVPLAIWGFDIYRQWFEVSTSLGPVHYEGWPRGSMSLTSASVVLFGTKLLGIALSVVVAGGSAAWMFAIRSRLSNAEVAGYALMVAMVVSPITWPGYLPIVIPALMARRLDTSMWAGLIMLWFASGIGILVLLASCVRQAHRLVAEEDPLPEIQPLFAHDIPDATTQRAA